MKKNRLFKISAILVLLFFAFLTVKPLLSGGFFPIHDNQSVGRLYELDLALANGQFPVRWVKNLGFGFGYPLFIFYPPLVYYIGELWHLIGFGFLDATKIVYGLSLILSVFSMYAWARYRFSSLVSLVCALFYLLAPYRAVDVYVRGALAEAFAFVWLPLIFLYADRFFTDKKLKDAVVAGIFYSLLMITHNLIVLPLTVLFALYFLINFFRQKNKNIMIGGTVIALTGLSLSAFFWIPSIFLKRYTIVDEILLKNLFAYKLHFVQLSQLWNSLWGFGGSVAGPLDGMSFKIGKIHILVSLLTGLMIFLLKKPAKKEKYEAITWLVLFVVSGWLATEWSLFVWDNFKFMQYLQFPWRYLTFMVLFSAMLAGYFLTWLKKYLPKTVFVFVLALVLFALLKPNLKLFQPKERLDVDDEYFISAEALSWKNSSTSFEFLPRGIELIEDEERRGVLTTTITKKDLPLSRVNLKDQENLGIEIIKDTPSSFYFKTAGPKSAKLRLNIFSFPGWMAIIDNQKQAFNNNDFKLIELDIPAGEHLVRLDYRQTGVLRLANLISLFSAGLVAGYLLKKSNEKN